MRPDGAWPSGLLLKDAPPRLVTRLSFGGDVGDAARVGFGGVGGGGGDGAAAVAIHHQD